MHRNRILFFLTGLTFLFISCIKRYDPEIEVTDAMKYVVTGQVVKGDATQKITISSTSSINQKFKYYLPVDGCIVTIADDKGNVYEAWGMDNGNYLFTIPDEAIAIGSSFKVDVVLPGNGGHIVSDYDQVQKCPDVDSVYFNLEQLPSVDPRFAVRGIRFYLDLNAENTSCRNFRWEAVETWEYKAILAKDISRKVCWWTGNVKNIFTLSTNTLAENKYKHLPLHFVDNYSSQRLKYGYSLLIRQYSLSDEAYAYWDKIRINANEQGGLYAKQPLAIKGNLHNLSFPEQQVLGFFCASAVTSKRIFIRKVENLPCEYLDCEPETKPELQCVDCLSFGGTNVKPYFWPD